MISSMQNNDTDQIIQAIQQVCQMRQITCLHAIESVLLTARTACGKVDINNAYAAASHHEADA